MRGAAGGEAVLLLALCYLSYFAGLLFMLMSDRDRRGRAHRGQPAFVRALLTAGAMAAALAFAAYYVNWTWPFLSGVRAAAPARIRRLESGANCGRVARAG